MFLNSERVLWLCKIFEVGLHTELKFEGASCH